MKDLFRRMRRRDGFTITEVMVAAFIVMLAVGGLSLSFVTSVRTNRFAANYYNAACLARNRIQQARTVPYQDVWGLAQLRTRVTKDGDEPIVGTPEYVNAVYERETIVTNRMRDCYEITVKVYYPMARGLMSDTPIVMKTMLSGQFNE